MGASMFDSEHWFNMSAARSTQFWKWACRACPVKHTNQFVKQLALPSQVVCKHCDAVWVQREDHYAHQYWLVRSRVAFLAGTG